MLGVGAAQALVDRGAAARRLPPQELDLGQAAAAGVGEERRQLGEVGAGDDDVDADVGRDPAQGPDRGVGAGEAVEAPDRGVGRAQAVDRDVDLAEPIGDRQQAVEAGQAAGGQVGDEAAGPGVVDQRAEPGQGRALAAAQGDVEDPGVGQGVEGAPPLGQAPLAGAGRGAGPGVAAGAPGGAAVGELEVGLEGRGQGRVVDAGRLGRPRSRRRRGRGRARDRGRRTPGPAAG
jgi:hypothetical protein